MKKTKLYSTNYVNPRTLVVNIGQRSFVSALLITNHLSLFTAVP